MSNHNTSAATTGTPTVRDGSSNGLGTPTLRDGASLRAVDGATDQATREVNNDFANAAADTGASSGVIGELFAMMRANKKWWLLPVIVALLLVGVLVLASTSALAPFIYTLF